VSPEEARKPEPVGGRVDLATLKGDARTAYSPSHPYRLAVEALPDTVSAAEYRAQLRILLPLSRVKDG
jgi:hypothetical protein